LHFSSGGKDNLQKRYSLDFTDICLINSSNETGLYY
jgi:hypothetical protein